MAHVLLLDKPVGPSSAMVLDRVKRAIPRGTKIGHAGTLDPFASGLLVCLLGRATKLSSHAMNGVKRYSGIIVLGATTTTDDCTGELCSQAEGALPGFNQVEQAAKQLVGTYLQRPPIYSAKSVGGRRAYARAREGESVALDPVKITVFSFNVFPTKSSALSSGEGHQVSFELVCSKGVYVRALARDLGELLGCGAHLAVLRRDGSGGYSVASASDPNCIRPRPDFTPRKSVLPEAEALKSMVPLDSVVLPWDSLFPNAPRITVPDQVITGVDNGFDQGFRELRRIVSEGISSIEGIDSQLVVYQNTLGQGLGYFELYADEWRFGTHMTVGRPSICQTS